MPIAIVPSYENLKKEARPLAQIWGDSRVEILVVPKHLAGNYQVPDHVRVEPSDDPLPTLLGLGRGGYFVASYLPPDGNTLPARDNCG